MDRWGESGNASAFPAADQAADTRLKNHFSASAGRESQGGGLLQLALARLSPAEQVLPAKRPLFPAPTGPSQLLTQSKPFGCAALLARRHRVFPQAPASAAAAVPDVRKGEKLVLITQKPGAKRSNFQAFAKSKGAADPRRRQSARAGIWQA
jgi:hypothetical protein